MPNQATRSLSFLTDPEAAKVQKQLDMAAALQKAGASGDIGQGYHGGKVYAVGNPWGNIAQAVGGAYMGDQAEQAATQLGNKREADYQAVMGARPTPNETLPMQGPTEDGGTLGGSFQQAKSGDRQVQEMEDWGSRLSQSRDPRAQTLGGAILTKSLSKPYEAQARDLEESENAATLKTLRGRSTEATDLTGDEGDVRGGFRGNVAELRKQIEAIPDLVERQGAMEQLNRQINAAPRKSITLPQSVELSMMPGKGVKAAAGHLAKVEAQDAGDRRLLNIVQPFQAQQTERKIEGASTLEATRQANRVALATTKAAASNIPEHEAALQKAVDDGRLDPMKVNARNRAFLGAAANNNPTMDFNDASAVANAERLTETEYSPKGISGRSYRSINTTINHLATLEKLGTALQNNDVRVANLIANQYGKQLGADPQTNFDAAKQIVAAEIMKSIVPGGGGVTERMELAKQVEASSSPAQLAGFIKVAKELMAGQLQSLEQAYSKGDETKLARLRTRLSPESKEALVAKEAPKGALPASTATATGAPSLSPAEAKRLEELRAKHGRR